MAVPLILSFTSEQFNKLKESLIASGEVTIDVTSVAEDGSETGTLKTNQVDLNYAYDGKQYVNITVAAKHGIAKFASDAKVYHEVTDMLHKYENQIYV